jgi:hypothetical protein
MSFDAKCEDLSFINQGETDRENEAVGPDERDLPADAERDERFERLIRQEAERQQRERIKKACEEGLLAMGIFPRSLVRQ